MVQKWTNFEKEALEVCFQVVACTCQPHSSYITVFYQFETVLSFPTVRVQRYEEHSLIVQFYCREKSRYTRKELAIIDTFHWVISYYRQPLCLSVQFPESSGWQLYTCFTVITFCKKIFLSICSCFKPEYIFPCSSFLQ